MDKPSKKTVVAWRNFLASPEGTLGLLYLKALAPMPFPDEDGKMIFAAGSVAGFLGVFKNLEDMIEDASGGQSNEAPDRLEE